MTYIIYYYDCYCSSTYIIITILYKQEEKIERKQRFARVKSLIFTVVAINLRKDAEYPCFS